MKKLLFPLFLVLVLLLGSCNGAAKKASEQTIKDFYAALRKDDSTAIKKYYENFDKLGGFYKSSSIEFKNFEALGEGKYDMEVLNHFKNIKGAKFSQTIHFLLKEDKASPDKVLIYDSKGLTGFKEERAYQFAVNTGFIDEKKELSDQEIARGIKKSEKLLEIYFKDLNESLRKEVVIENWGWEYGYVNTYADGHGKIVNRSKHDFSTLKFTLTFVDAAGNVTQTDDGYLVYAELKAGESSDFTTLTSDIGKATKAYIQIQFDTYELLDMIYSRKYKGNEVKMI